MFSFQFLLYGIDCRLVQTQDRKGVLQSSSWFVDDIVVVAEGKEFYFPCFQVCVGAAGVTMSTCHGLDMSRSSAPVALNLSSQNIAEAFLHQAMMLNDSMRQ